MDLANIFDDTIQELESAKKGVALHISDSISKLYHLTVAQSVLREIGSHKTDKAEPLATTTEPVKQLVRLGHKVRLARPRRKGQLRRSQGDMEELSQQIHDALLPIVGASQFSPIEQKSVLDKFSRGGWDTPWRIMHSLQRKGFARRVAKGKYRLT